MKRPAPPLEAAPPPADPPPEGLVAGWLAPGLVAPGLVLVWASTGMVMKALATRQAAICFFSMIFLLISLGPLRCLNARGQRRHGPMVQGGGGSGRSNCRHPRANEPTPLPAGDARATG